MTGSLLLPHIAEIIGQRAKATGKPRTDIIVELLRVGLVNKPVEQRETGVEQNREYLQELIDNKTSYLANAMNEVKSSLESEIEALKTRLAQQEVKLGEY